MKLQISDIISTVLSTVKITVLNIILKVISCIQNHYPDNESKLINFDISISLNMTISPLSHSSKFENVFNYSYFKDYPLRYLNTD